MKTVQSLATILVLFMSTSLYAAYNSDISGVVTDVVVSTGSDYIYFKLNNQPVTHPQCNPEYFAISSTLSADRRRVLLSRAMLSQATERPMSVGYDNLGSCSGGYIRIYKLG